MGMLGEAAARDGWAGQARGAPYRASAARVHSLDLSLPQTWLATACRASPGGRVLYAFVVAAVRDYFVLGHVATGAAHAEADGVEVATAHVEVASTPPGPVPTLEAAIAAALATEAAASAAGDALEAAFTRAVDAALAAGDPAAAVAAWRSMPGEATARAVLGARLYQDGILGPYAHARPAAPDAERGAAMLAWLRADLDDRAARDALEPLAWEEAERILAADGPDDLEAFGRRLPRFPGVFVRDRAYEAREDAEALAGPAGP